MDEQSKKRLFIALNLPLDIRKGIIELINNLASTTRGVKWVNPNGLHITLHFLGYLNKAQEEQVKLVMQTFAGKFNEFQFQLGKINAFPGLARPRVIFLECPQINGNSVFKLQELLGKKLIQAHIAVDKRDWGPHITLGRIKYKADLKLIPTNLKQATFSTTSFELIASTLKPQGAEYKEIFSCKL